MDFFLLLEGVYYPRRVYQHHYQLATHLFLKSVFTHDAYELASPQVYSAR